MSSTLCTPTVSHTDFRFGVEIECIARSFEAVRAALVTALGAGSLDSYEGVTAPDGRLWKVVRDGSLSTQGGGGIGAEVVSPILTYADMETLQDVVRAVRRAGSRVNSSCGVHVHVDASTLEAKHITNLVKIVHKQEAIIEHALGILPGRRNYCQSIDPAFLATLCARRHWTMDDLNRAWYGFLNTSPSRYDQTRYRAVNLHSLWSRHGTVEFRWGNGTLHAGEIKSYVQFALCLVARAKRQRSAQSVKRPLVMTCSKFDMRLFLCHLQMNGPEFKTARDFFLRGLVGATSRKPKAVAI